MSFDTEAPFAIADEKLNEDQNVSQDCGYDVPASEFNQYSAKSIDCMTLSTDVPS